MKTLLVTLIIGLIVCALAQTDQRRLGNANFQFVNTTIAGQFVQCARSWVSAPSAEDPLDATMLDYRVTARAISLCEANGKLIRAAQFEAGAGSRPGAHFWARTLVKQFRTSTTTIKGFESFLAFDKFGTYSAGNGTFSPAQLDWSVNLFSPTVAIFTNITVTKTVITGSAGGDDNSIYSLSFSSIPGVFPLHQNLVLNFILDVTPVVTQFGFKVLTPDSFKLTVSASGIDYNNTSTPGGVYLGVWLLTGKAIGTINRGNSSSNLDAPGIPSTTNGNLNISDNSTDPDGGFFSFDLKAWGDNTTAKDVDVIYIRSATEDNTFTGLNLFTQVTARRIHFATTVKSATVEWDPALGATDSLSGAGSLLPSLSLLLVALIALLL